MRIFRLTKPSQAAGNRFAGYSTKVFHTIRNAMAHVPKVAMRSEVARHLRRIFDADEPAEAERRPKDVVARYRKIAPQLAA